MPGGMVVRELFTTLGLDVDAASFAVGELYASGVKTALQAVVDVAKAVAHGMMELVVGTAETGDRIDELAQQAGVTTDSLQEMAYAAGFSSVGIEELTFSLAQLAKKGIKDPRAEMLRLAEQMEKMPNKASRVELATTSLGRAGRKMVPLLAAGRQALEDLFAEAPIMSEDAIKASVKFSDTVDSLKASFVGLVHTIGGPLIEAIGPMLDELRVWFKENQKVIKTKLKEWATGVGKALTVMWKVVKALKDALFFLAKNLDWVATVLAGPLLAALIMNAGAIWANVTAYAALGWAAVATAAKAAVAWIAAAIPFVALALAITTLILLFDDFLGFLDGENSAIGDFFNTIGNGVKTALIDAWTEISFFFRRALAQLKSVFTVAFDGTWDGLKAGALRFVEWLAGTVANGLKTMVKLLPGGEAILSGLSRLTGVKALAPNTDVAASLMGGGASPTASQAAAAGTGPGPAVQTTVSAPITIVATPGMDPHAIAGVVREHIRDELKTQHEEAKAAVGR